MTSKYEGAPSVSVVDEVVASLRNAALLYEDGSCARSNLVTAALLVEHLAQHPAAVDGAQLSRIVSEWRSGIIGATSAMISIDGIVRQPGGSDNDR